ncbi:spermidine/putrescine ABC transporter substrate-binding protein [Deinococcus altitudinis]|uniref:polyamine ABC transporter substrate-binding protein n=1 Tax=Deinococcus altitudinis TaxID=468914 RepID=UPI0038911AE8
MNARRLLLVLLPALLLGCQRQPGQTAASTSGPPPAAPAQPGGRVLRIFMWSDYIDPQVVKDFEKQNGVRVIIDTYESNEAMLAKLQGGGSSYDLANPSNYFIQAMLRARLLQPLQTGLIPNFKNVAAGFLNPGYDPGNRYTVPYQYAATGLAYNAARYTPPSQSWSLIFGPSDTVKFVLLDDPREVIGAALKYLGYSVNSASVPQLRAARDLLRKVVAKRGFLGFDGGPGTRNRLLAGDIDLGQIYVGDLLQGAAENKALKVFLPKEGTTISTDTLVLLAGAPNPALARRFIDTVLAPKVSAAISNYTSYGNPNAAARPYLDPLLRDNPAFNPPQADLKSGKVEFIEELPPGKPPRLYDRIWSELKSR